MDVNKNDLKVSCQQNLFVEYSNTFLEQKRMLRGIKYMTQWKLTILRYFMCKNLYTFKMILTDNINMV